MFNIDYMRVLVIFLQAFLISFGIVSGYNLGVSNGKIQQCEEMDMSYFGEEHGCKIPEGYNMNGEPYLKYNDHEFYNMTLTVVS